MEALNRISEVRALLELTQADFAAAIGLTQGAVSQYERNLTDVRPDVARRIVAFARARGVSISFNDIYAEPPPDECIDALDKAIKYAGAVGTLASSVGVPVSAVSMWKSRGRVPAEHCPAIERLTKGAVRCEELRPDIPWGVLRGSPQTEAEHA